MAYQHDPKNDPKDFVRYKMGKDDVGVEMHAPTVAAMGEVEFLKQNMGDPENKVEPTLFASLRPEGREQRLKAAFQVAQEHNTKRQNKEAPEGAQEAQGEGAAGSTDAAPEKFADTAADVTTESPASGRRGSRAA